MSSVFKKLLSQEFGESNYNKYFYCFQKLLSEKKYDIKKMENEEIYEDIYNRLKEKERVVLQKKSEQLLDTMFIALSISKNYIFIFLCYLAVAFFLIIQGLVPIITISALVLLSGCFIYKTYEFVINKYCYIDAHLIIIYKSVLDQLLEGEKKEEYL